MAITFIVEEQIVIENLFSVLLFHIGFKWPQITQRRDENVKIKLMKVAHHPR